MNPSSDFREGMERTSREIARAWARAIDGLARDAVANGASLATHTLVTVNMPDGGMMAWVSPNDEVSGVPRFPRAVLERSRLEDIEMRVTVRTEAAPRSTSAPPPTDAKDD
jgi:hypothetical protein